MKPIKHMRSKRGFYIGRLSKQVGNHTNHTTLSSELAGSTGRGMGISSTDDIRRRAAKEQESNSYRSKSQFP